MCSDAMMEETVLDYSDPQILEKILQVSAWYGVRKNK